MPFVPFALGEGVGATDVPFVPFALGEGVGATDSAKVVPFVPSSTGRRTTGTGTRARQQESVSRLGVSAPRWEADARAEKVAEVALTAAVELSDAVGQEQLWAGAQGTGSAT